MLRGWAKTLRTGIMMSAELPAASELDLLVSNVIVMDPVLGVFKANIGVKDGVIVGIGRAGNPDVVDNPDLLIGSNTAPVYGQGYIATPGGIDTHVHLVQPRLIPAALAAGMTTLITGGLNENPAFNLRADVPRVRGLPGEPGRAGPGGQLHGLDPLERQIESGACGLKVHEDYAGYPSIVDQALTVADVFDVQIAMHTDGLNESCELHETVAAIAGRSIHAYHVEGIGGGHSPDILAIAGVGHVIGSSTTPTIPYGRNVVAEHHAMMWSVHGMNPRVPSDREMIADRVRDTTMRAESVLHELGAISIINSDSQGMGRIGEVDPAHLAARAPDEADAGRAPRARQPADPPVPRQVHDQPRPRPRRGPVGGIARAGEERRHRALAARVLRRQAGARDQGRLPRLGRPRRGQRLHLAGRAPDLRAALGGSGSRRRASASTSCPPPRLRRLPPPDRNPRRASPWSGRGRSGSTTCSKANRRSTRLVGSTGSHSALPDEDSRDGSG